MDGGCGPVDCIAEISMVPVEVVGVAILPGILVWVSEFVGEGAWAAIDMGVREVDAAAASVGVRAIDASIECR